MVIHRVHLEMEKAKLDLENQQCYDLIHGNEIIIINDTDSDGDGAEPLGQNTLSVTVFNTGNKHINIYISLIYIYSSHNYILILTLLYRSIRKSWISFCNKWTLHFGRDKRLSCHIVFYAIINIKMGIITTFH